MQIKILGDRSYVTECMLFLFICDFVCLWMRCSTSPLQNNLIDVKFFLFSDYLKIECFVQILNGKSLNKDSKTKKSYLFFFLAEQTLLGLIFRALLQNTK